MNIDFNEINGLKDPELAQQTLLALVNKSETKQEKKEIYLRALNHFKDHFLLIDLSFFSNLTDLLFEEEDLENLIKLNDIVEKSKNYEFILDLAFKQGKFKLGLDYCQDFLELLKRKGLTNKALMICERYEAYLKKTDRYYYVYLELLSINNDDDRLLAWLRKFRAEIFEQKKSSTLKKINLKKIFLFYHKNLSDYSYKTKKVYIEKVIFKIIASSFKKEMILSNKELMTAFIVNEERDFLFYLLSYFNDRDILSYRLIKKYTLDHYPIKSEEIINQYPSFLSLFRNEQGELRKMQPKDTVERNKPTPLPVTKNRSVESFKETLLNYQENKIDHLDEVKEYLFNIIERRDRNFSKMKFSDLLVFLKDLAFYDLLEEAFWLGRDRNLVTEAEIYLVGKTFFDLGELSKAYSILAFGTSNDVKKLFSEVEQKKKFSANA